MSLKPPLKLSGFVPGPNAFIYYSPKASAEKEKIFYNPEAWRILSMSALPPSQGMDRPPDLSGLCGKWCLALGKALRGKKIPDSGRETGVYFLDVYQSRRRLYAILGVVLVEKNNPSSKNAGRCLFVLERVSSEGMYLSLIGRQWKLNRREKELVRLLLGDKSNKEIAHSLGLKENTVKGYMKLLMRRLGVGSRTGIVTRLLTGTGGHPLGK